MLSCSTSRIKKKNEFKQPGRKNQSTFMCKIQAGTARDEGAKESICQVNEIGPYTRPT